jgi:hypothetical protein
MRAQEPNEDVLARRVTIRSGPGEGTLVLAILPVKAQPDADADG